MFRPDEAPEVSGSKILLHAHSARESECSDLSVVVSRVRFSYGRVGRVGFEKADIAPPPLPWNRD
eukprot:9481372-Pyramimonas_sp.AAC.1